MTQVRIFQVDAFTSRPFVGNPAAVCLMDEARDDGWKQALAAEMNLSETAFVERRDDGFGLRWFTPTKEVDLCGHATLASAHVLWEAGEAAGRIEFHTRSGILTASPAGNRIQLDFPASMPSQIDPPDGLADALGSTPRWVGIGPAALDYLVELESADAVRKLDPDLRALRQFPVRGMSVTALADATDPGAEADFVSRFFGPAVGVDEDPVTGSAHCALGPFWASRLGRDELLGYQASRRGGYVGVRVEGERVLLLGEAVTVFRGELSA